MDLEDAVRIRLAAYPGGEAEFICPEHGQPMRNDKELERFICKAGECKRQISYQEIKEFRRWILCQPRS